MRISQDGTKKRGKERTDRRKRGVLFHVGNELTLKVVVENASTTHRFVERHRGDVPSTNLIAKGEKRNQVSERLSKEKREHVRRDRWGEPWGGHHSWEHERPLRSRPDRGEGSNHERGNQYSWEFELRHESPTRCCACWRGSSP